MVFVLVSVGIEREDKTNTLTSYFSHEGLAKFLSLGEAADSEVAISPLDAFSRNRL